MSYCTRCGAPMPDGSQFCQSCGARADGSIRCSKCGSDRVHISAKEKKNQMVLACTMALGGLGLMIFGIIGGILGAIIGLIVGAIVKLCMRVEYETVCVCQDCGNTFVMNK